MEVLEKDEKSRNKLVGIIGEIKELAKGTVKIGSTATNLAKAGKSVKLFRETNNLQKITQAALPELNVVANVRTASTQGMSTFGKLNKLSKGSICLSGIGAGLSAYDIYQTWKPNNTPESLKELDEIIESLKKDLENLETRQLEAQIEVSSEWNCRVM
ncbi:MAG: hypothetical protein MRERV_10c057 [Mycoplasmataceae bacterium RV_VA103A]|nr:MAG: hypothetical protein MRERV_10c057 [Mycoplasmataceae bacterium RV_VA103A]